MWLSSAALRDTLRALTLLAALNPLCISFGASQAILNSFLFQVLPPSVGDITDDITTTHKVTTVKPHGDDDDDVENVCAVVRVGSDLHVDVCLVSFEHWRAMI